MPIQETADKEEALEKKLWKAADKLRKTIDAAEYKHIVLGLIFLKYISDAFWKLYEKLVDGEDDSRNQPSDCRATQQSIGQFEKGRVQRLWFLFTEHYRNKAIRLINNRTRSEQF